MEKLILPTKKQRDALEGILEGKSVSKSMLEAGYTPASAKNPKNLTESNGFKMLCEENGLTENLLVTALVEDIEAKPQNRKSELELGFKVLGLLKDKEQDGPRVVNINIFSDEQRRRIAERILGNSHTASA